jgi:hypothetical protein
LNYQSESTYASKKAANIAGKLIKNVYKKFINELNEFFWKSTRVFDATSEKKNELWLAPSNEYNELWATSFFQKWINHRRQWH